MGMFAVVWGLQQPAGAATSTFAAEADAFVIRSRPRTNRGNATELRIRNDVKRTYVRFDVALAPGDTVTSAALRIFAIKGPVCARGGEVLRAAGDTWGERTITWNNQPGPAASLDIEPSWSSDSYVSFDVTPAVMGSGKVSFVLRHAPGCNVSADSAFRSRETPNDPELVVETSSAPPEAPQCSDGLDNDSDGLTDHPADPGCTDANDNDETGPLPPPAPDCSDGLDNDSDGLTDHPADPGCTDASDDDETNPPPSQTPAVVAPFAETPAIGTSGDRADDPAISASYVIGTDKARTEGGLETYTHAGARVARLQQGDTNNVDLRTGFPLGNEVITLVGASHRSATDLAFYRLNSDGSLTEVGRFGARSDVYGFCLGKVGSTFYAYATSDAGVLVQYRLDGSTGVVTGDEVRAFDVGEITEGCAVDDELGYLYASEEINPGTLWRYGSGPSDGSNRVAIDSAGAGGRLKADLEGVDIAETGPGTGYIIVSTQGDSLYAVYDRAPPHAFRGKFDIAAGNGIDGTEGTDGIDVSVAQDLFVAHDNENGNTGSNFKFVRWSDIALALGLSQSEVLQPELSETRMSSSPHAQVVVSTRRYDSPGTG